MSSRTALTITRWLGTQDGCSETAGTITINANGGALHEVQGIHLSLLELAIAITVRIAQGLGYLGTIKGTTIHIAKLWTGDISARSRQILNIMARLSLPTVQLGGLSMIWLVICAVTLAVSVGVCATAVAMQPNQSRSQSEV